MPSWPLGQASVSYAKIDATIVWLFVSYPKVWLMLFVPLNILFMCWLVSVIGFWVSTLSIGGTGRNSWGMCLLGGERGSLVFCRRLLPLRRKSWPTNMRTGTVQRVRRPDGSVLQVSLRPWGWPTDYHVTWWVPNSTVWYYGDNWPTASD